jgi:hypothetical protein
MKYGFSVRRTNDKIEYQPDGSKQKGEDQARDYEKMWNAEFMSVADFPTAHEKIKGKVMNPSGDDRVRIVEKFHHPG